MYIQNPFLSSEKCYLLSEKKEEYYIHNYQPSKIIDNILSLYEKDDPRYNEAENYVNNLSKIFDLRDDYRKNRCNCISITLYSTGIDRLIPYLYSIDRTIKNVRHNLPNWLV